MEPRTLLCFGDSNTHGTRGMRHFGDRRRFARPLRWPSIMEAALGEDIEVIAEGHPGRTSVFDDPVEGAYKNGARVLPSLLETHRPLDLVILMLGTNDQKARFNLPAIDIALGIERLARMILASDAGPDGTAPKVLIAAPVPVVETGCLAEMFTGAEERSRQLPARLQARAEAMGVGFIDLAQVAEVDRTDGVHLSQEAQAAIGSAIAQAVRALFP